MKGILLTGTLALLVTSVATPVQAFTVDLGTGTNLEGWQISNDGGASYLSPTARPGSDALWPDPFGVPGVWQGMFEFFVPDDVENASLSIFDIGVDDRVVLTLNGIPIPGANDVIFGNIGSGVHDFGDGRGPVPFEFTGSENWLQANPDPLVTSANFIYGGVNQLIAYVNNTNTGDPTALPVDEVEITAFFMKAEVNAEPKRPVPEPGSLISLLGLGVMAGIGKLGQGMRRKHIDHRAS